LKTYKPTDILTFGQYKGIDMRFVYTFDPEHVQWLIINLDHFAIDLKDYANMHTCQLDINDLTQKLGVISVGSKGVIRTLTLKEFLKEFMTVLYEENYLKTPLIIRKFSFSEKALTILKSKFPNGK
jgi:hypothetical protein